MADRHVWSIELTGHHFDLEDLPRWLADGRTQVQLQRDKWVLVSDLFEPHIDAGEVRRTGEELLGLINGLGRVLSSDFRPIGLGIVRQQRPDGSGMYAYLTGVAEGRSKASGILVALDGIVQPDPRVGAMSRSLEHALRSAETQRVLTLLGRPELTWSDLYRALEVILANGDGPLAPAGVSKKQVRLFKQTANSFSSLGLEARHAHDKGTPPPEPMTLEQARDLLSRLTLSWLHLAATDVPEGAA